MWYDFQRPDAVDPEYIDIAEDREVFRWMRVLSVSEEELILAVRRVGPRAEDVRRALRDDAR